jgi:hypothetical protein
VSSMQCSENIRKSGLYGLILLSHHREACNPRLSNRLPSTISAIYPPIIGKNLKPWRDPAVAMKRFLCRGISCICGSWSRSYLHPCIHIKNLSKTFVSCYHRTNQHIRVHSHGLPASSRTLSLKKLLSSASI